MALSDLNFASGFQNGMNSGLSLLDAMDQRKDRAEQRKRDNITWNQKQEEHRYNKDVLRPLEKKKASLGLRELEDRMDRNKTEWDWKVKDRPEEQERKRFEFQQLKSEEARKQAEFMRGEQERVSKAAYNAYAAAQQAAADGDEEAQAYWLQVMDENAIPVSKYLDGTMGKAADAAKQASLRKLPFYSKETQEAIRPLGETTMRASGRSANGLTFAGFIPGQDGKHIPVMMNDKGELLPATQGGTGEGDDPIVQLSDDDLIQYTQQHMQMDRGLNGNISPGVKERFMNKPSEAFFKLQGGKRVVHYGNGTAKEGGSRSWRNNNPGNLQYGSFAKKYGAIGTDGRFAIFPDEATGERARVALLRGKYGGYTIAGMISKYAPAFENDTGKYANVISQAAGVSPSAKISELDDDQFRRMVYAMRKHEGWKPGNMMAQAEADTHMKRGYYQAIGSGLVDKPEPEKKTKQWSKLDDGTLYNEYTGETKAVGGQGQQASGRSLMDMFGKDGEIDPAWKPKLIEKQLWDIPYEQRAALLQQVRDMDDPAEVEKALRPVRMERDSRELAADLMEGVDPELMKLPEGAALQALAQQVKQVGLPANEVQALVRESMETVGDGDPQALFQMIGEKLKIRKIEQDRAKQTAATDRKMQTARQQDDLSWH